MSVEETRARLHQRVQQAIEGSGIAFSTAQKGQLDELVNQITNGVLVEFDALLGSMMRSGQFQAQAQPASPAQPPTPAQPPATAAAGAPATPAPAQEQVLWEGRPFLGIGESYVVTSERVRIITGVLGRATEDIELIRVQDVDHSQGLSERMLNIGDVFLHTTDKSQPDVTLRNVTNPVEVHEIIRRAILDVRRRYPFAFRQEI